MFPRPLTWTASTTAVFKPITHKLLIMLLVMHTSPHQGSPELSGENGAIRLAGDQDLGTLECPASPPPIMHLPPSTAFDSWGRVAIMVPSFHRKHQLRQAWRQTMVPRLRDFKMDVWFAIDGATVATKQEIAQHNDSFFLSPVNAGTGIDAFRRRSIEALVWALARDEHYEWFVRTDDDIFICAAAFRHHLENIAANVTSQVPGVHIGKYMGRSSDVWATYNRFAVKTYELLARAKIRSGSYLDLVDPLSSIRVIKDDRYSFGRGPSDANARRSMETGWQTGWNLYHTLPHSLRSCFCASHMTLHVNMKTTIVGVFRALSVAEAKLQSMSVTATRQWAAAEKSPLECTFTNNSYSGLARNCFRYNDDPFELGTVSVADHAY